jgi:hypoxanthine-DNA glycosylase
MFDPSPHILKRCFPPVTGPQTRVLILGSLPGEESLARGQYYANPRNQFWRLTGAVVERDLIALGYDDRLSALFEAGIGLWDTVAEAQRTGSLDTAIRGHQPNDLVALADSLPELRAIAFNGGKSASIGIKLLTGEQRRELITLPSSSPALTRPFADKLAEWMKLKPFLG